MKLDNYITFLQSFGLKDFTVMSRNKSSQIIKSIRSHFIHGKKEIEILSNSPSFIDSELLRKTYLKAFKNARSYIYTAEHEVCSVVLASAKECLIKSLSIAKESALKTCFIAGRDLSYYFRINYNDESHIQHPDTFQIEMNYRTN